MCASFGVEGLSALLFAGLLFLGRSFLLRNLSLFLCHESCLSFFITAAKCSTAIYYTACVHDCERFFRKLCITIVLATKHQQPLEWVAL